MYRDHKKSLLCVPIDLRFPTLPGAFHYLYLFSHFSAVGYTRTGAGAYPPWCPGSKHRVCIRAGHCVRNPGTRMTYEIDEQGDKARLRPGSWTAHWTFRQTSHWNLRLRTAAWKGNRTVGLPLLVSCTEVAVEMLKVLSEKEGEERGERDKEG